MATRKSCLAFIFILLLACLLNPSYTLAQSLPAFPGAEGFGAISVGGRGGKVFKVTNLNSSGPGSLRDCAEASMPRICIFEVSGIISLPQGIKIEDPYLTIAGQTAPGDGITLRNTPTNDSYALRISGSHDIIIRHIRIRPGYHTVTTSQQRAISVDGDDEEPSYNIILDHISTSWSSDQVIDFTDGTHNVTLQWSIVSEGLQYSKHPESPHSKGLLVSGKNFNTNEHTRDISIHHNIFAHNSDRNPRNASWGLVDVVNNVIYNWQLRGAHTENVQTAVPTNFIGNYFKHGLDTPKGRYEITGLYDKDKNNPNVQVYVKGNIGYHRPSNNKPETDIVDPDDFEDIDFVTSPFPAPSVTTTDAFEAYEAVLANAGSISPHRDTVDQRVVDSIISGTGRIIDHEDDTCSPPHDYPGCGYPVHQTSQAPADTDNDGIPNNWELEHGLDPANANDGKEIAPTGYTWLEEYINSLADQNPLPTPSPTPTPKPGDANGDGVVDIVDYGILVSTFWQSDDLRADFNGSGTVDIVDYGILVDNFWN